MTVHEARRFLTYQDLSESQEEHDAESQPGEMDHFQLANNDPRNDTPMSSPEPASVGRRKERPSRLVSPPCSLPNGLKERPGEPDSAEWARLTGRQDPVAIRDRYSNPLHLERTILSPAISEVSELPTRAGSFKTQSSLISLAATASHPTANYSEEGSTWSTTSSTFSTMSAPVDPLASISNHVRALDSATNQRARSDPALRQVTTVSEKDHQHRAKSVSALVEHASADEQEELAEVSHKQASNRQASDRRAREEEQRKAAEERFAVRSQARERYLDRRESVCLLLSIANFLT